VHVDVAHDAGRMASDSVRSVLENFLGATVTVVVIILIGLGWRAAAGVTLQLPSSLAIVPVAYWLLGFTLNPVSIAAMILAIGLLADDNVIIMENIRRHFRAAGERSREVAVRAVDEVGNPTVLAVFLIIATFMPTAFIGGEMGQYTRAIPVGTSLAIGFSLVIALTVTPYVAYRVLRPSGDDGGAAAGGGRTGGDDEDPVPPGPWADLYRAMLVPLFDRRWLRVALYVVLLLLFAASIALVAFRAVHLTLVPILDRDVFVVEIERPSGTPLAETVTAGSAIATAAREFPGVRAVTLFAGTDGPNVVPPPGPLAPVREATHRASLYVQLDPEQRRHRASFEIARALAFERLPPLLERYDARAWVRRIPSGPSSENAVQAEVFAEDAETREAIADRVAALLDAHPAAAEIERFPKPAGPRLDVVVDRVRAAARGISVERVAGAVRIALSGRHAGAFDVPDSRRAVPVVVRLDRADRRSADDLGMLRVANGQGETFAVSELATVAMQEGTDAPRYRRNGLPVTYVAAHVDRGRSQPLSVQRDVADALGDDGPSPRPEIRWFEPPGDDARPALFWGGEWETTQQVYRDLGVAAAVVLAMIYIVLAGWFGSYGLPLLIMTPIPLVFIGVIPGHWLMDLDIAGLGVLGIIALAGIVVRNALLLVDFTERRLEQGLSLRDALIGAGAVRTRPILLTAGTVLFGSGALVFEPALEPLGLTLISGVLVSTVLTMVLIPVLYYQFHAGDRA
jgi:multidrug efflux pump subunit AcrB